LLLIERVPVDEECVGTRLREGREDVERLGFAVSLRRSIANAP
jgi:hypothetical protein